jgi:ABC-type enterochelin transport system permease subunit
MIFPMFVSFANKNIFVKDSKISGFKLGVFTAYLRDRKSNKNIMYSYEQYDKHYIIGIIYSKSTAKIDEIKVYKLDNLKSIQSVIKDFDFIVQEQYKIAYGHTVVAIQKI